ncbi:BspA family leucine-rich repeat surface protein [Flavobacterium cerinum]|uniref:BspA family leucine-rich repeat surface protein n=1 Tax=Flavobacterium cerinum TaxID=2502784 RepID=A0ABY5IUT3_9FLAO|nr:BspA family leucine-rich repeat surface protein [Flavobacterium cerinum]UUC46540.1 BspA family leucine-rich repeat surface protein [Flavobacterium cerinum]
MGTIADKLTYLGQTKSEIRDAIISKGGTVTAETPFREYAERIREIKSETTVNPDEWKRPADWLSIEGRVKVGDQKFVGLYAIFEDSNFAALSATGNYTVDWGDGVVENYASGIQANHIYSYSAFPGTDSSRGYRQAIVTVTPQAGQSLTNINLQRKHTQAGLGAYSTGWLDVRVSGSNITSFGIGGVVVSHRILEAFSFLGSNQIADFRKFFLGCSQLQAVLALDTSKGNNFGTMFSSCSALKNAPMLETGKGLDFSYMFESCTQLKTVPLLETSNGASFSGMFYGCSSLKTIPLFNTIKGIDFSMMFSFNTALETVPLLNFASGEVFTSMFESCSHLRTVPLFETSKATDFSYMFQDCVALQTVPLFKASSVIDFTSMFFGCVALQTLPAFDTAKAGSMGGMLTNCTSLSKATFLGTKVTISYVGCKLSRNALVDIFKSLATGVTSKSVTITNNWGASSLSASEKAIATGKGWTIIG